MVNEEAIMAKLAQILERLEALESVRTEHITVEGGTLHVQTGEHAPILVAHADAVSVRAKRRASIYVGADLNGEVKTKTGKLSVRCKGDLNGNVGTAEGQVNVKSKGDVKFDFEPAEMMAELLAKQDDAE